jgi:hypothetical protein
MSTLSEYTFIFVPIMYDSEVMCRKTRTEILVFDNKTRKTEIEKP